MTIKRKSEAAAVRDGQCWAVPVPKLGFCPLVIARAPKPQADVDIAFAYMKVNLTADLPDPASVGHVETWPKAWLGLVATAQLRKGRWNLIGDLPRFDPDEWPIPPVREASADEAKPVEEWGLYGGEMWSIETTLDEPSVTVISNTPATREEALRFPRVDFVSAVSKFENALYKHFKNRRPCFWDMKPSIQAYAAGSVKLWRNYAKKVRAGWSPDSVTWLTAGRRTDRNLTAGAWLGFPLKGGGFGAAILMHKQLKHERFFSDVVVMSMRRRWDRWPRLEEVQQLKAEDGAMLAPTTMSCVADGRWRVLGYEPTFGPEAWPCPILWGGEPDAVKEGRIAVRTGRNKSVKIQISPDLVRLDPGAGSCAGGGMTSPWGIELNTARIINGVKMPRGHLNDDRVTPRRISAWRKINAAIRQEIGKKGG